MRSTGEAEVADRVKDLTAAVDSLTELDPADLPAGAQLHLLRGLWPLLCRLDAQITTVVGVVNARGSAAEDGAISTVAWLRSRLHAGNAAPRVQVAKALAGLPEVAAAFSRGEISFSHAQIAAKAVQDVDPAVVSAGVDKLLAQQASEHPPGVFARAATRIRDHYDPDQADRRGRHRMLQQWLDVDRTFGGSVSISGVLAPDNGELLLQTLGAFMRPVNPDGPVPATTRRAEALAEMCQAAAGAAPEAGGHKPQVAVIIDWETLRGQATDLFNQHGAWTGGRYTSGTPLHPETARRMACDCGLIPVVLGAASDPLDVGRLRRLVTPAIRRALDIRDGGCRFPGCDRPSTWCDAHHLKHWANGGSTSVDSMILLCRRHHVMVHEECWSIHLNPHTGTVTANGPHGHKLDIVSHPRAHSP